MINVERLCAEFSRLAAIASPSGHEQEIAGYLMQRLRGLGGEVEMDAAAAQVQGEAGNIIARFPGTRGDAPPLLLCAHLDTVSPALALAPSCDGGVFRSGGETVLGADDKSGIAQIIEAIETVQEQNFPYPPLEVVLTVCEEVGLLGAKHLDYRQLRARRAIVLDTSGVGMVAVRAPYANKIRIVIEGIEAHSGLNPEQGLSAIQVAAEALVAMPLGRIDPETTANIGLINGGQATNIIPRTVQLLGEARSFDPEKLQRQTEQMLRCVTQAAAQRTVEVEGVQHQAQVQSQVLNDYPGMNVAPDCATVQTLLQSAQALGQPLAVGSSGGGSDANILNQHGIETVNLATGMQRVHTVHEFIRVEDLAGVCRLLTEFIRRC